MEKVELWLNTSKNERYHSKRARLSMYLVLVAPDLITEESRQIGCFEHITITGDTGILETLRKLFPQSDFNEFLQS